MSLLWFWIVYSSSCSRITVCVENIYQPGSYNLHTPQQHPDFFLQAFSACLSDCTLDMQTRGGTLLHYDFSPLANVTGFHSSSRFSSKGLRYFQYFNVGLCGKEVRKLMLFAFVKFCVMCILTCWISLKGPSASNVCGQCNREWEKGQRLHLSVHRGSLWNQETEHRVFSAFPYWWLTHWYELNPEAIYWCQCKYVFLWKIFSVNTGLSHLLKSV